MIVVLRLFQFCDAQGARRRRFQSSRATRYRTLAADGRRETTRIATSAAAAIDWIDWTVV
jgi:hypothetical protein